MAVALSDFANGVRVEVPGCPEPLITDAILNACIDFCTKTELVSELVSLTLVPPAVDYEVPVDPALYPAKVRNVLKNGVPLDKTTAALYALSTRRSVSGPVEAFYAPTHKNLVFEPIPSSAEALELDVVLRPAMAATEVPDVLFDEWKTTIAAGAKADLMLRAGVPWANPALGAFYQKLYDGAVATAAVAVAHGNADTPMRIAASEV